MRNVRIFLAIASVLASAACGNSVSPMGACSQREQYNVRCSGVTVSQCQQASDRATCEASLSQSATEIVTALANCNYSSLTCDTAGMNMLAQCETNGEIQALGRASFHQYIMLYCNACPQDVAASSAAECVGVLTPPPNTASLTMPRYQQYGFFSQSILDALNSCLQNAHDCLAAHMCVTNNVPPPPTPDGGVCDGG